MHPTQLTTRMPQAVSVEITTHCPLQCTYCNRKEGPGSSMSFEQFLKLKARLERIPNLNRITFCGIGESLLHKDFYRIVHQLGNYRISIVTSGTLLINYEELNGCKNIDKLILSIDATSENTVKTICGETYNYQNLIANLTNLVAYNKEAHSEGRQIDAVMNCTLNENNIEEIPGLMDFAAEHQIKIVHYSLPWGREDFIRENRKALHEKFILASTKAQKYGIFVDDPFHSFCCKAFNHILPYINLTGEFFPCGYGLNRHYSIGNILSDDFNVIWEDPRNDKFKSGQLCQDCFLVRMGDIS